MQESYAERWARRERDCWGESLTTRMIPIGDQLLPSSAAPCLSFDDAATPRPIYEVFASPADWSPDERTRLCKYLIIGSDGAGNPICVDQVTSEVFMLDHEDWFQTVQFVNSSIQQLAESMLAYMGERDSARFISALAALDPDAAAEGTFWACEAACINDA